MPTKKQLTANKENAKKSTGPRTPEGKAKVAQNAIKHGLCSTQNVIFNESQEEFNIYQQQFIADLAPQGSIELIIADRIVSLSWRLKRSEQFQTEAINAMIDDLDKYADEEDEYTPEKKLGEIIVNDFTNNKVLDCLLTYERRIESSLYKAMHEIQRMQKLRQIKQTETQNTNPDKQTQFTECDRTDNSSDKKDLQQKPPLVSSMKQTRSKPFITPETPAQQVAGSQRTLKHPLCSET